MGLKSCKRLKLVNTVSEIKCSKTDNAFECNKKYILKNYPDVFSGIGRLSDDHKYSITIDKDVMPVVYACRHVPFKLHAKLKSTLDNMEADGKISKVDKPTDWVRWSSLKRKMDLNDHVMILLISAKLSKEARLHLVS